MGLRQSLKKLLTGEPFNWGLPPVIGPDECTARCSHCSGVFIIGKSERRVQWYCMTCR
jgi:PHP family Zn ribbon phosphoesterase